MIAQPIAAPRTPTTAPARPRALRSKGSWLRRLLGGGERSEAPRPGARAGEFELVRPIDRGGMGEIWLARHRGTRRPAAVKLLATDARPGTPSWTTAARRLELEAALMASMPDRYVAAVYDVGWWSDGSPYYAMELIEGVDLQTLVRLAGPQTPERVAQLLGDASRALAAAHARGIVHRDIKPANVMLDGDDVKLIDFGVAQGPDPGIALTAEGAMVGTPMYMPPEAVLSADPVGPAADVYALGCVAYYLLSGSAPFDGGTPPEVMYKHVHYDPPSLPAGVPDALARLVERCLNKQPSARPTAVELSGALDELYTSVTA